MLVLFALAASNDLSNLRVDAGSSGTGSGPGGTTSASPTTAPDDEAAAGTGTSVSDTSGSGTPGSGNGGLAPGGGVVTGSTRGNGFDGLGASTTISGALPGVPLDTGVDGSIPGSSPDDSTLDTGTGGSTVDENAAGGPDATRADGSPVGSATTAAGTTGSATADNGAGTTNSTTAVTPRPRRGSSGGLAATLRLIALMTAFGAAAAGVAWLAGSIVRAILTGRRTRRDEDDDEDDEVAALVLIDPASAGWTLEQLRRRLEAETDPRLAIREAYAVVESGFGIGGGLARRRTETALQYLERTLGMIDGGTKPLRVLTGLFLLARFSNRPMNEAMRRAAIDAVVELQARFRAAEEVAA